MHQRLANLLSGDLPPALSEDRWRQTWDMIDAQTTRQRQTGWLAWVGRNGRMAAAIAAMFLLAVLLQWAAVPAGTQGSHSYAFATQEDSDIEQVETYSDDETPLVITSGGQDVVVVWMVQNHPKSNT
jgi:hypothetical protein